VGKSSGVGEWWRWRRRWEGPVETEVGFVRRLLATLSLTNVVAAIGLTIVYSLGTDQPVMVLILASGLALQGLFTIAVLGRSFGSLQRDAKRLAVVGNGAALIIGVVAFVVSLIQNLGASDPEYGPMAVAILIAAHGAAALVHLWPSRPIAAPEESLSPVG
jgi:hypothetical protein